ncbi:MAG: transcription termination/antitermination NusG family protein, partial [Fervidobacterium pennivorans]
INARKIVVETNDRKFSRTFIVPESAKPVSGLRVGASIFQGTFLASSDEYVCDIDGKILLNEKVKKVIVRTPLGEEDTYVLSVDVYNPTVIKKSVHVKAGQTIADGKKIYAKSTGRVSIVEFALRKEIVIQKTKKKKLYPGYLFVEMVMNDHTWEFVRGTPFVMGFVSAGGRPLPLKPEEAHYVLRMAGLEQAPQIKQQVTKVELEIQSGDGVKIITGPFEGFTGVVKEVDEERQELKVNVTIFGRETPVTVNLTEVEKSLIRIIDKDGALKITSFNNPGGVVDLLKTLLNQKLDRNANDKASSSSSSSSAIIPLISWSFCDEALCVCAITRTADAISNSTSNSSNLQSL